MEFSFEMRKGVKIIIYTIMFSGVIDIILLKIKKERKKKKSYLCAFTISKRKPS